MPFWKQNELFWDDDLNPEGIVAGATYKFSENTGLTPVVGYFIAQNSDKKFRDDGRLFISQLKLKTHGNNKLTISSGIIYADNISNTPDDTQTFKLNYTIWMSSLQFNLKDIGLTMGIDYSNNFSNYDNNANVLNIFKDQTTGFVGNLAYSKNKFVAGYYYAHIQKYAVIDYYAGDDWLRWGNTNYTRASNYSGHELRFAYHFTDKMNTVIRAYSVKGIRTNEVDLETGTRIRIDFNICF